MLANRCGNLKQNVIMSIQENQISDLIDVGLEKQKEQFKYFKSTTAFPVEVSIDENGNLRGSQTSNFSGYEMGLTKLEYFTAKAMQGLLSNPEWMKVYQKEKYLMQAEIVADVSLNMAYQVLKKISSEND